MSKSFQYNIDLQMQELNLNLNYEKINLYNNIHGDHIGLYLIAFSIIELLISILLRPTGFVQFNKLWQFHSAGYEHVITHSLKRKKKHWCAFIILRDLQRSQKLRRINE